MATYAELYGIRYSDALIAQRLVAPCLDYATTILGEASPTAPRKAWAIAARDNPIHAAEEVFWSVLIANKSATVNQITTATDATLLTNVKAAIDARYGAT